MIKKFPFQFISLQSNIHNLTIQLTFFQRKKKKKYPNNWRSYTIHTLKNRVGVIPNFLTSNLFSSVGYIAEWRARDLSLPVAMELVIWPAPPQLMYRLLLVQQPRQQLGPTIVTGREFLKRGGRQRDTASIARAIGILLSRRNAASSRRIICDTDSSPRAWIPLPSLFFLFIWRDSTIGKRDELLYPT